MATAIPLDARIYVAGHAGVAGSAIVRRLQREGFSHLIVRRRADVDLNDQSAVAMLFRTTGPEYLVLAAGRVGGIAANMAAPVEFLVQNLAIQSNVLLSYLEAALRKTVFLGLHPVPDNGKLERLAQTILAFIERPSAAGFPG